MSETLTDEKVAFRAALRDFAAREAGTREQRERLAGSHAEGHNQGIYEQLAELGYLGCCFPEEYGGSGGDTTDACILMEETSRGMLPVAGISVSVISAKAVENFGTEEQKHDFIGGVCGGRVAAISMSEPGAGSDVGALRCAAVRVEGGYVVNGQKTWTSAAHIADRILLLCRTDRGGAKHEGITMLDIPAGTDGMEIRGIDTMGGREVNDIFLTDAFVGEDRVIGVEGAAWMQLMAGLNFERVVTAASFLGLAERAFDDALAYVGERHQFGRPIGAFQAIRHRIADLATEIECVRLLVYDVARRADENPGVLMPREASMAKLKASEVARRVALDGMQMMGGYGYATEYDMERHVRAALPTTIVAGASEIQRDIIGKTFGL
jgi:alkylation response protein AidB-like acyl-CoA dehydrogenase